MCADGDFLGTLEKEERGIHLDVSLTWFQEQEFHASGVDFH